MANWPSPNYNRIIETDPQIIKVYGAAGETFNYGWGSKPSLLKTMSSAPQSPDQTPGQPAAPEITLKHV